MAKEEKGMGAETAAEPAVPVYAGTLCLKGWRPGKQVTEQEYLAAVTAFEKGPMAGTGGTR